MKAKKFIWFCCIVLCACEGEKIDSDKVGRSLQLKAEVEGFTTRASDAKWEKGDAIGVYMVTGGKQLNASALRNNVKYVVGSNLTSFTSANSSDEIILPFDGSSADFISYYPYRDNISDLSYSVDLSKQSVQADIDLMYADDAKGFNSKNPNVNLRFSHQLSKIVLEINHSESKSLSNLSVVIANVGTKAAFNLATGALSAPTERGNIQFKTSNSGTSAEAILMPETDLAGMKLWFMIGDEPNGNYSYPLTNSPDITTFVKSTKYTYKVTLSGGDSVSINQGNITNWTEAPAVAIAPEITEENPPVIKGSKNNPYTVAEAQANLGETDVWVQGYIAGSVKNSINTFISDPDGDQQASNIVLVDDLNNTAKDYLFPVQLPSSGAIRNALNLQTEKDNLGKKVVIKGGLETYYSVPGLRNINDYYFP